MIGWLQGKLLAKKPPALLLDVNGVGYELEAPMTTFYDLPEPGSQATLFVHHLVRDDAQSLYAFARERERDVFRLLIKVNGVGAKLALTILSGMDAVTFSRCVLEDDTATLVKLPGIGKKTAQRLVMEMRDRLNGADNSQLAASSGVAAAASADPASEAINALVALGFKPQDASRQVHAVANEASSSEDMVRLALKTFVR